jgi:hypothetical protein
MPEASEPWVGAVHGGSVLFKHSARFREPPSPTAHSVEAGIRGWGHRSMQTSADASTECQPHDADHKMGMLGLCHVNSGDGSKVASLNLVRYDTLGQCKLLASTSEMWPELRSSEIGKALAFITGWS